MSEGMGDGRATGTTDERSECVSGRGAVTGEGPEGWVPGASRLPNVRGGSRPVISRR